MTVHGKSAGEDISDVLQKSGGDGASGGSRVFVNNTTGDSQEVADSCDSNVSEKSGICRPRERCASFTCDSRSPADTQLVNSRRHKQPASHSSLPNIPMFSNISSPKKLIKFRWREKKIMLSMMAANLSYGCIAGMFIPFFPTQARERGLSQGVVGAVFGVYAFALFLLSPMASKLIPRVGATRMFHLGLGTAGLSTLAFGVLNHIASADSFIAACFAVRVVEAFGTAAFLTASYTIVANQFPDNLNLMVAVSETMCAVGIATGPALGGGLYSLGGFGLPFYVLGGVILLVTAVSCCVVPTVGGDRQRVDVLHMSRLMVCSCEAWLNAIVLVLVAVAWTALDPGIAPYTQAQLSVTPAQIGLYYLLASGVFAAFAPVWGKLCDSVRNNYVQMMLCLVLASVGLALIAPSLLLGLQPSRTLLALGLTMRELFLGGAFIPTFGNLLRAGHDAGLPDGMATQAYVSGVWGSGFAIGNAIGPSLAGAIGDVYDFPSLVSLMSVGMLTLAVPVLLQCVRRWRTARSRDAEREPLLPRRDVERTPGLQVKPAGQADSNAQSP